MPNAVADSQLKPVGSDASLTNETEGLTKITAFTDRQSADPQQSANQGCQGVEVDAGGKIQLESTRAADDGPVG